MKQYGDSSKFPPLSICKTKSFSQLPGLSGCSSSCHAVMYNELLLCEILSR
ncbi:hypothetical protein MKX03_024241, partial [Papaver bracteatum]